MANIYNSVEELIGNTPIMRLSKFENKYNLNSKILAKLEYLNPAGSVKDRVALAMINKAEENGDLQKNSVIIEPTSGNTGIGLAAVAAARGYKMIVVMPETMSEERKKLMVAFGAQLILSDGNKGMSGAIEKAKELAEEIPNSFIAGQFANPSNAESHFNTTGPEIYRDTDGLVDIFVAGVGTGGTITGTGAFLKSVLPNIKVVAVEPKNSPVLSSGVAGIHGIQGIGAGFIPDVLDVNIYDEVITVSDEDAFVTAREFGKTEGFLVGISSGAVLFAAKELAERPENSNRNIVVLLPDSGSRYLSANLYDF